MSSFQRLDAAPVQDTVARLESRIRARFPERGLLAVAGELRVLTADVAAGASAIRERIRWVRLASRAVAALVLLATVAVFVLASRDAVRAGPDRSFEWVPLIESTINDLVFAGLALWFLYALPQRLERGHLLDLLHRLRSLAHIVDMHQLTKDPERLRADFEETEASVALDLTRAEMEHYLDYCSELLSLVGKVAALCAEESRDSLVLTTVSDLETLTTGMSRKIWQKISLLPREGARPVVD
ncbi:hypothetical protein HN031_08880 [Nocardioides sp. zg-1308]|uniref:hypothetical protein n=1 Tax=Nocardioides TaxID=1839 RepID=UPI001557E1D4|nr:MULTISPECIES: hypothetical protein [unclassified Nocardioides]NPD04793.1 hypothetical protein [Nocardioides sp. zg-1308]WQQ22684.1 hypothetical protein SHK17_01605 [Nocardioides sp. S-34]